MTTITVSEQGTIRLPQELLTTLGWQSGSELELSVEHDVVTIQTNVHSASEKKRKAIESAVNASFGMIKVKRDEEKGDLLDFDVSTYATLFDKEQ